MLPQHSRREWNQSVFVFLRSEAELRLMSQIQEFQKTTALSQLNFHVTAVLNVLEFVLSSNMNNLTWISLSNH